LHLRGNVEQTRPEKFRAFAGNMNDKSVQNQNRTGHSGISINSIAGSKAEGVSELGWHVVPIGRKFVVSSSFSRISIYSVAFAKTEGRSELGACMVLVGRLFVVHGCLRLVLRDCLPSLKAPRTGIAHLDTRDQLGFSAPSPLAHQATRSWPRRHENGNGPINEKAASSRYANGSVSLSKPLDGHLGEAAEAGRQKTGQHFPTPAPGALFSFGSPVQCKADPPSLSNG
jgi:hypothetical protein